MNFMYLAVEDELSEAVGKRIIREMVCKDIEIQVFKKNGFGYLRSRLKNFSEMSKRYAVLMMTDLDTVACAPSLRNDWFNDLEQPKNFIFRVAVREVEAWLLADAPRLAEFLGVNVSVFPGNPEEVTDPKAALIGIARKAKRDLRLHIVPEAGAKAKQGLGYNKALCPFVETQWNVEQAARHSDSLNRACKRVAALAG